MSPTGDRGAHAGELARLVGEDRIVLDLAVSGKRHLLQELARLAARHTGLSADGILAALLQRERLGTTGIGDGIAIPHAKVAGLDRLVGFVVRLAKPIDFDALDGRPIDLVVLLLAPEAESAAHLKALARFARLLRDPVLCARLRDEPTAQGVHELLGEARDGGGS